MPYTDEGTGFQKRDTSLEAAQSMDQSASNIRAKVLGAITTSTRGGLTADEVATKLGLTPFAVRPRITELSKAGLIVATSEKRKNASGRRAQVWWTQLAIDAGF